MASLSKLLALRVALHSLKTPGFRVNSESDSHTFAELGKPKSSPRWHVAPHS